MKTKYLLALFLVGISISINSSASMRESRTLCDFEKIIDSTEITLEEEFAMLLEPTWTPNFQAIAEAISVLAITPPEDLNNPKCPIYKYAREFLDYYNRNKEKITKDKLHLTKLLDAIQERTHEPIITKSWWQIF